MSNSPDELPQWSWWKATWDCSLILFCASLLSVAAIVPLPPFFYRELFPGIGQAEMQFAPYTLLLLFWPSSQAWIVFKWVRWRGVQHIILPLWPLATSLRRTIILAATISAFYIIAGLAMDYFEFFQPTPQYAFFVYSMNSVFAPMMIISGALAAPVAEEAIFRGLLQSAFQASRLGFWGASMVVSLIWSLIHWYDWPTTLAIAALGICLTYLRRETGSLLPGMVAHGVINLVLFLSYIGTKV